MKNPSLLRHPGVVRTAMAIALAAPAALLGACGGGDDGAVAVVDPSSLVVVLDIDRFESPEAVAAAAARDRGAPGEAERVLVLVHSRRTGAAERLAERLGAQGLAVQAISASDAGAVRHAQP